MFGFGGPAAAPAGPAAVSQKTILVKPGTMPSSVKGKEVAILSLEQYLASTRGVGGHNYPLDHEALSGDTVCAVEFWQGVAGCALSCIGAASWCQAHALRALT